MFYETIGIYNAAKIRFCGYEVVVAPRMLEICGGTDSFYTGLVYPRGLGGVEVLTSDEFEGCGV